VLKVSSLHPWLLAPRQARLLQTDLATSVRRTWDDRVVKTVAGCDVHFPARRIARAAVVVMSFSELEVLASHLGLVLQIPTIGCAKSRLVGEHDEVEPARGSTAVLRSNQGEPLGMVVRTRDTIKPVYVSVGHLVTLNKAVEFVLQCSPRYRIPEPLRRAHNLASQSGAQA
jgi:deoxyinosine 3'endonuclease (endonuclease V)